MLALGEMGLRMVTDMSGKLCEIQSSENHELAVANLIFMNNLYFLDIVEDTSMQINITEKKSNHRQKQNSVKFIKI